ncbi:MAG: FtsX-like permease family protein [bacterium]
MRRSKLIIRSLIYYWRINLAILLGAGVSIAILTGALLVGDSVQYSLEHLVTARLGRTEFALDARDRLFREELIIAMAASLRTDAAPVLRLNGIAISKGGTHRVNQVQVLGVDERFFALNPHPVSFASIPEEGAVINQKVASRLGVKEGDTILLRIENVSRLPHDAPLVSDAHLSITLPLTVIGVASDEQFGRFSLRANQVAPYNVFISIAHLSKKIGHPSQANMMLIAQNPEDMLTKEKIQHAMREHFTLQDAGLTLAQLPGRAVIELRSDRVFIEKSVMDAALKAQEGAQGVFTYFINQFRSRGRMTPYSFVSAPGEPLVPRNMRDDEIIINKWLADDLSVREGDSIELLYYVVESMKKVVEKKSRFVVQSIVPIKGNYADKELMPHFPGLADSDNCRDWDPGVDIDLSIIRAKDEEYWDTYRGTPKAFITLAAARKMWENRFGTITSVRYPSDTSTPAILASRIMDTLTPSSLGYIFTAVREEGTRAGREGVDFGHLFVGLSFFIIAAALVLLSLFFILSLEHRLSERGILRALGFSHTQIQWLLLVEGGIIALLGGFLGVGGALLYTKLTIYALGTVWRGTVGTSAISFHITLNTVCIGFIAGVVGALLVMWITMHQHRRHPIRALLNYIPNESAYSDSGKSRGILFIIISASFGVLLILLVKDPAKGKEVGTAFFMAGSLMLISMVGLCYMLLKILLKTRIIRTPTLAGMGIRNCSRKRGRSIATVGILACGIFLIFSVAANRHNPLKELYRRESGTGGFILYGETTLPILYDLNTTKGKEQFGIDPHELENVNFVHLYVREGDDASCLNLNRVQKPHIVGIRPEQLAQRRAFTFTQWTNEVDNKNPWMSLVPKEGDETIPAIADHTVIVWGLGKSIGDILTYTDERGRPLRIKLVGGLANSIFQGSIVISQDAFIRHFPSISGARAFLVDGMEKDASRLSALLSDVMQDMGLSIMPAAERLAEFNRVETTYLSIYLTLGGLGLILGSIGMGIVLLRNVLERRGELALLRAVGFSRVTLVRLLFYEHGFLLGAGLICGLVPSCISLLPALLSPGGQIPWNWLGLITGAIMASGTIWILLATLVSLRGNLLSSLRTE